MLNLNAMLSFFKRKQEELCVDEAKILVERRREWRERLRAFRREKFVPRGWASVGERRARRTERDYLEAKPNDNT